MNVPPTSTASPHDRVIDSPSSAKLTRRVVAAPVVGDARAWRALISAIAESADQGDAAETITRSLAQWFPDHSVRWGWATRKRDHLVVQRMFDSRLGSLDIDNEVRHRLARQWNESLSSSSGDAAVRLEPSGLVMDLAVPADDLASQSRGRIWVMPPMNQPELVQRAAKRIEDSWLPVVAAVYASRPSQTRWGRWGHRMASLWGARGLIGAFCIFVSLALLFPTRYRIDAVANVTAMDSRLIAAPFAGTLSAAHVGPGDIVSTGQVMLELDGRPLRIEMEALTAEIEQAVKDEDIALAAGKIADSQLAGFKRQGLIRRRELIESRLAQLVLRSPMDGVVIQGDLQRQLGTPVELGQTLLEIAPPGSVEIQLEIPEVEVGFVGADSDVKLWFPAAGGQTFATRVSSLWPAATIRETRNVFIAEAALPTSPAEDGLDPQSAIRVGMRGAAVIRGPLRPWVWSWVRTPVRRIGWMLGW